MRNASTAAGAEAEHEREPRISIDFGDDGLIGMLALVTTREFRHLQALLRRGFLEARQIGFILRAVGLGLALQFAQAHLCLARGSGHALKLVEALLQRRLARTRDVVIVLGALQDPPDFLVDQPLGIAPLRPDIGDKRMTRAVSAR